MAGARMLDEDEAEAARERVAELTGGPKPPDGDGEAAEDTEVGKCYSRAWLYEQYHVQGQTLAEIGELCGVTGSTIATRMEELGLDRRPPGSRAE